MRWTFPILACLLAACGADDGTSTSVSDGPDATDATDGPDATADASPDVVELPCPHGQTLDEAGACRAVGIQGCDAMFIDPQTGLCEPTPERCPAGQIPVFTGEEQGCIQAGIPDCIDMFIDPDSGLCDPTPEHCPPGQIPVFSGEAQGCRGVAISDCAPEFVDPETGICAPDPDLCDEGHIALPTQGCVSLDPPGGCGDGTWGNVEALAGDVHVDGAYVGGASDGSRDKPWTLIGQGLSAVQSGGRLVLAAGDYDEGVLLDKSISLVGRCSSMVTISGTRAGLTGTIVLEVGGGAVVTVSDVTVSGPGMGISAHSGAQLTLTRAALRQNQTLGIFAGLTGTSILATHVAIVDTQPDATGSLGGGVLLQDGASITFMGAHIANNQHFGMFANDPGSTILATDLLVAHTQPGPGGNGGSGVEAVNSGSISLYKTSLVDNSFKGAFVSGPASALSATDLVIARTQLSPDGTGGRGIEVSNGGTLTLERASLVDNHDIGLAIGNPGSSVTARDLEISRTAPEASGASGWGLAVVDGASLDLARAVIAENQEVGLIVGSASGDVVVTDAVIARTRPTAAGVLGWGVQVSDGGQLTLARSTLLENHHVGLVTHNEGTLLNVSETHIARTEVETLGIWGPAMSVEDGGQVILDRMSLDNNVGAGISVSGSGTSVQATDLLIARTQPGKGGVSGFGAILQNGASMTFEGGSLIDNHSIGIFAMDPETAVSGAGLLIARTAPNGNGDYGRGIQIQDQASLNLTSAAVLDSREMALSVAAMSVALLEDVVLSGTSTGVKNAWGLADGLLVSFSEVEASGLVVHGNDRAGVFYNNSSGALTGSLLTSNAIGLVNQGQPQASVGDENIISGNEDDTYTGADLELPDNAAEIPEIPNLD